jgi:hypothetical protein
MDYPKNELFYVLGPDGKTPQICPTSAEWTEWMREADARNARRVALDELPNGVAVSTVFLGLRHGWPWRLDVFETLVAGESGPASRRVARRYDTWDDAAAGHAAVVEEVRGTP